MNSSRLLLGVLLQFTAFYCGVPELRAQEAECVKVSPTKKASSSDENREGLQHPRVVQGPPPDRDNEAVVPQGFPPLPLSLEWRSTRHEEMEGPMLQGSVYGISEPQYQDYRAAERLFADGKLDDSIAYAEKSWAQSPSCALSRLLATAYRKKGDLRLAQLWRAAPVYILQSNLPGTVSTLFNISPDSQKTKIPELQSVHSGVARNEETEQTVNRLLSEERVDRAIEMAEKSYLCSADSVQLAHLVSLAYKKKKQVDLAQMWASLTCCSNIESANLDLTKQKPASSSSVMQNQKLSKLIDHIKYLSCRHDAASRIQLANSCAALGNLCLERAYSFYRSGRQNDSLELFAKAYTEHQRCLQLVPTKLDSARKLLEICRIALALNPGSIENRKALAGAYLLNERLPSSENAATCESEVFLQRH